jgi:hypothetical protein
MVLKKKIARTLINEIIVDLDDETQQLHFIIHWHGGCHTRFEMPKPLSGALLHKTALEDLNEHMPHHRTSLVDALNPGSPGPGGGACLPKMRLWGCSLTSRSTSPSARELRDSSSDSPYNRGNVSRVSTSCSALLAYPTSSALVLTLSIAVTRDRASVVRPFRLVSSGSIFRNVMSALVANGGRVRATG